MPEPTPAQIDKLKAEHGELHAISAGTGDREVSVLVKTPNRERWTSFKAQAQDPHRKATAMESLVLDCVVHPSREEMSKLLNVRPGLSETFGSEIAKLAGLEELVVTRKL